MDAFPLGLLLNAIIAMIIIAVVAALIVALLRYMGADPMFERIIVILSIAAAVIILLIVLKAVVWAGPVASVLLPTAVFT